MDPADILNAFTHPSHKNVYILGCAARRVTIYAQQCRAFNLAWALAKGRKLPSTAHVGIVGGGIGGMTLAAALLLLGYEVTLFEKQDEFAGLQRGCSTRFVHPRIYDWPQEGALAPKTEFPCLNWTADTADRVMEQIDAGWSSFANHERFHSKLGTRVSRFEPGNRPRIVVGDPGFQSIQFDSIVLAVGFGSDSKASRISSSRAYWDVDSLHREGRSLDSDQRFLVSGCGDGGLIDVLRLRLRNFTLPSFVKDLQKCEGIDALGRELLEIDRLAFESANPADSGQFIYDAYSKLQIPPEVKSLVENNLKRKSLVILNGKGPTFMSITSCILNRLAVFIVSSCNGFGYIDGKFSEDSVTSKFDKFVVQCKDTPKLDGEYDAVVVRHGPTSIISGFDQSITPAPSTFIDGTQKPQWPRDAFRPQPSWDARQHELAQSFLSAWTSLTENEKTKTLGKTLRRHLQQVNDDILLFHATAERLRGSKQTSSLLDRVIQGRLYPGHGRLEIALLHFQNGEIDEATRAFERAASAKDEDIAENARTFLKFLRAGQLPDSIGPIESKHVWNSKRERMRFSLIRGLVAFSSSNLTLAQDEWNSIKNRIEPHLSGTYPFIEVTNPYEIFFVNIFTNPAFCDSAEFKKQLEKRFIDPLRNSALVGLRNSFMECFKIIRNRPEIVEGFCRLGAEANPKWKKPPKPDDITTRLTIVIERLQRRRGKGKTKNMPG